MATRTPLCYYYNSDPEALLSEIEWCRHYYDGVITTSGTSHQQQDEEPTTTITRPPPILLVPHGAYCDSGPLVMDAFQRFLINPTTTTTKKIDTVILIGTEHASSSKSFMSVSDHKYWSTPLGNIQVDKDALDKVREFLPVDPLAFTNEHSIENQLPFLQHLLLDPQPQQPKPQASKKEGSAGESATASWKMLAISVHGNVKREDLSEIGDMGRKLSSVIKNLLDTRSIAIVATTDYTHAGPFYGELPPPLPSQQPSNEVTTKQLSEYIRSKDLPFLNGLCRSDECLPSIHDIWQQGKRISMCGLGSTLLTMELARNVLGRPRVRLLRYAVGSDICDRGLQDQTGFATIAFESF